MHCGQSRAQPNRCPGQEDSRLETGTVGHPLALIKTITGQIITPLSSPGQTIKRCQRDILQHWWAKDVMCVWPPCCDMLGVVRSSLKMVKFEPTPNKSQQGGQTHETCCDMLRWQVAIVCRGVSEPEPTLCVYSFVIWLRQSSSGPVTSRVCLSIASIRKQKILFPFFLSSESSILLTGARKFLFGSVLHYGKYYRQSC